MGKSVFVDGKWIDPTPKKCPTCHSDLTQYGECPTCKELALKEARIREAREEHKRCPTCGEFLTHGRCPSCNV
jgi:hypothetical protein